MTDDDPINRDVSPIADDGHVPIDDADGWFFMPFEHDDETGDFIITLVREEDDEKWTFTLPTSSSRATSSTRSRCW